MRRILNFLEYFILLLLLLLRHYPFQLIAPSAVKSRHHHNHHHYCNTFDIFYILILITLAPRIKRKPIKCTIPENVYQNALSAVYYLLACLLIHSLQPFSLPLSLTFLHSWSSFWYQSAEQAVDRSFILTRCLECAPMINSPCTNPSLEGENNNNTSKNLVSADILLWVSKSSTATMHCTGRDLGTMASSAMRWVNADDRRRCSLIRPQRLENFPRAMSSGSPGRISRRLHPTTPVTRAHTLAKVWLTNSANKIRIQCLSCSLWNVWWPQILFKVFLWYCVPPYHNFHK